MKFFGDNPIRSCLYLGAAAIAAIACMAAAHAQNKSPLDAIPYEDKIRDFSLYDLNGAIHHSKDYRGKALLVIFWTVDCQLCQVDISELEIAYQQLKDDRFDILAIHAGDQLEKVKKLPGAQSAHYTILMDMDLELEDWGVPAIPAAYLVDADGYRRYRAVGARDWSSASMINTLREFARRYGDS